MEKIIQEHIHILEQDNIRLRPTTEDDFELLAKLNSDPEVLLLAPA